MIKELIRSIVLREKASSEKFITYLRKQGVQIGEDVQFYSPSHTLIDTTQPWLLTIGNHVRITHGVIILTHDYAWSVLKGLPENAGRILGACSPVRIGKNVFIGMNAIITRGVAVGDNVVIGAGSVVTGDCESNSVYAGVPAKKIMTIQEFLEKREEKQLEEAKAIAIAYRQRMGKEPPREVFSEYFMLFCNADEAIGNTKFRSQMATGMGYEASVAYMRKHTPMFSSYEDFLRECYSDDR